MSSLPAPALLFDAALHPGGLAAAVCETSSKLGSRSGCSHYCCWSRAMAKQYGIKHFYDITNRSDFRANPDYKGVCHVALAQEGHCKPGKI